MTKIGMINQNEKRKKMVKNQKSSRDALRKVANDRTKGFEERFDAMVKLSQKPRNSSAIRVRNRCSLTGRSRAYHGYFGVSRIMLRDLAAFGLIPGLRKSSW